MKKTQLDFTQSDIKRLNKNIEDVDSRIRELKKLKMVYIKRLRIKTREAK